MRGWSFSEPGGHSSRDGDLASIRNEDISGITQHNATYPVAKRVGTSLSTEPAGQLESLSLKSQEPLTRLKTFHEILTSASAHLIYSPGILTGQLFPISRDAEDFISGQKKSVEFRKDIIVIGERALEYLKKQKIAAEVSVSLFTDPEYDDWVEPKIIIQIPEVDLEKAYGYYNELLSYSLKGISKKTLRRMFVTIESKKADRR